MEIARGILVDAKGNFLGALQWDASKHRPQFNLPRTGESRVKPGDLNTRLAGGGGVEAGRGSAPGPGGLIAAACAQGRRRGMHRDADSRVLVFGSEGATDPAIYAEILGAG